MTTHYAYKLEGGSLGLSSPAASALAVDEKAMSATFVISDIRPDRVGDVIVPEGIDLTHYRANPLVYFGHGPAVPGGLAFPVGKAEDPSGRLAVTIEPGRRALGTCYFHSATVEAAQCFELVRLGVLRGASIGFNPISPPVPLQPQTGQMRVGSRYDRTELLEWSIVGTPCHPHATTARRTLDLGKLAGSPLAPAIRKSLEAMTEAKPAWSNGFSAPAKQATPPELPLLLTAVAGLVKGLADGRLVPASGARLDPAACSAISKALTPLIKTHEVRT